MLSGWKHLLNGSNISGIAKSNYPKIKATLNEEATYKIGKCIGISYMQNCRPEAIEYELIPFNYDEALIENYNLDDGAFMVAKVLIKLSQLISEKKSLTSIIENLPEPEEGENELRIKVESLIYKMYGEQVIKGLNSCEQTIPDWKIERENFEGTRVNCKTQYCKVRFLLRTSPDEPLMPLNIESDKEGDLELVLKMCQLFFQNSINLEMFHLLKLLLL